MCDAESERGGWSGYWPALRQKLRYWRVQQSTAERAIALAHGFAPAEGYQCGAAVWLHIQVMDMLVHHALVAPQWMPHKNRVPDMGSTVLRLASAYRPLYDGVCNGCYAPITSVCTGCSHSCGTREICEHLLALAGPYHPCSDARRFHLLSNGSR